MIKLNRRTFTGGVAASVFAPHVILAQSSHDTDVVIVGAGAAGLAAAQTLLNNNITFSLVEASDRIGGRAFTETSTFGVPYDHGPHWLNNGSANPYNAYGKANGFDIYPAADNFRVFDIDNQEVTGARLDEFWRAWSDVSSAISVSGDRGQDVSAAEAIKDFTSEWKATLELAIGPWEMAKDFEDFSTVDWWNSANGGDWYCREGYGALVAHYGRDIPVSLDTPVTAIDWSGDGVAVETARGTIRSRIVMVTVSTGVLSSGAISFSPMLPVEKQESFARTPMGVYNHIALQFTDDVFGLGEDGYLLYQVDDRDGFGTLTNAGGFGIAYCDVGGSWAEELESWSDETLVDYALTRCRNLLGNSVDKAFVKGAVTRWGQNPLTYGSYASSDPGYWDMRRVLRQQVGDRIYFAGEACHSSMWATVGGAHLSGRDVAMQVVRALS